MITRSLEGKALTIDGNGQQIRDWLHVEDHARTLLTLLENGVVGSTYCIGGHCEKSNLDAVATICTAMNALSPKNAPHSSLITFVKDREGHDQRYTIDS